MDDTLLNFDGLEDSTVGTVKVSTEHDCAFKRIVSDPIKNGNYEILKMNAADVWEEYPEIQAEHDRQEFLRRFRTHKSTTKARLSKQKSESNVASSQPMMMMMTPSKQQSARNVMGEMPMNTSTMTPMMMTPSKQQSARNVMTPSVTMTSSGFTTSHFPPMTPSMMSAEYMAGLSSTEKKIFLEQKRENNLKLQIELKEKEIEQTEYEILSNSVTIAENARAETIKSNDLILKETLKANKEINDNTFKSNKEIHDNALYFHENVHQTIKQRRLSRAPQIRLGEIELEHKRLDDKAEERKEWSQERKLSADVWADTRRTVAEGNKVVEVSQDKTRSDIHLAQDKTLQDIRLAHAKTLKDIHLAHAKTLKAIEVAQDKTLKAIDVSQDTTLKAIEVAHAKTLEAIDATLVKTFKAIEVAHAKALEAILLAQDKANKTILLAQDKANKTITENTAMMVGVAEMVVRHLEGHVEDVEAEPPRRRSTRNCKKVNN